MHFCQKKKQKKKSPNFCFCACLKKMTIYLIMPELLENMLFLLQHFSYLFVGKLGENQRNEEELVKNAVFWLPGSESLVVTKGWNWKDDIEMRGSRSTDLFSKFYCCSSFCILWYATIKWICHSGTNLLVLQIYIMVIGLSGVLFGL